MVSFFIIIYYTLWTALVIMLLSLITFRPLYLEPVHVQATILDTNNLYLHSTKYSHLKQTIFNQIYLEYQKVQLYQVRVNMVVKAMEEYFLLHWYLKLVPRCRNQLHDREMGKKKQMPRRVRKKKMESSRLEKKEEIIFKVHRRLLLSYTKEERVSKKEKGKREMKVGKP